MTSLWKIWIIFIAGLVGAVFLGIIAAQGAPSIVDHQAGTKVAAIKFRPVQVVSLKAYHRRLVAEEAAINKLKNRVRNAYLTFDDGPNTTITPYILDILKKKKVKATFFVVGFRAKAHPELIKRMIREGHTVGNHGWSHNYATIYKSTGAFISTMDIANGVLKKIIGKPAMLIRPPGGAFGWLNKQNRFSVINGRGYRVYNWHIDSGDGMGSPNPGRHVFNVVSIARTFKTRKHVIILMHDTKKNLKVSLPVMIDQLRHYGYRLKPLTADVPQRY